MRLSAPIWAAMAAAGTVASCTIGTSPGSLGPATSPRGTTATVTYQVSGGRLTQFGELIEVTEDGLLVLLDSGFTRFNYALIVEARFSDSLGVGRLVGAGTPEQRTNLSRLSRYPFGLTPEQLAALMEARGQSGLHRVGR